MKKVKFPIFIVLGLIIFVPFFIPAKAQTPSYVSVNVGEYYQWDMSIHYGDWDSWFNDNMTYWWDLVWNQTNDGSDLTTIHDSWIAAGPAPQCGNPVTVEVIHPENTTAGTTDVFGEGGYLVLNYIGIGYDFLWDQTWTIANDTSNFAALTKYGTKMATSDWLMYGYNFAPIYVNWTEYVALGNIYMGAEINILGVNLTLSEITDGFSMYIPAGDWYNNTLPITINTTYVEGVLDTYSFQYGTDILIDIELSVNDDGNPRITSSSSDFTVEQGYSGIDINWTATDVHPNIYRVTLDGSSPGSIGFWANGTEIHYSVPEGLITGVYEFLINFTDDLGNSINDTVIMTVEAIPSPIPVVTDASSDFTVDYDYTGIIINWTATDGNPDTYSIMRNGTEVVGATAWINGTQIQYSVPDNLTAGDYIFTIIFTDFSDNSINDTVIMNVEVLLSQIPVVTDAPSDFTVDHDYSGITISWIATDGNPDTYFITLNGIEVVGATAWTSGTEIQYSVPENLTSGHYIFTIVFTDFSDNIVSDTVIMIVDENPLIPGYNVLMILGIFSIITICLIVKTKNNKQEIKI